MSRVPLRYKELSIHFLSAENGGASVQGTSVEGEARVRLGPSDVRDLIGLGRLVVAGNTGNSSYSRDIGRDLFERLFVGKLGSLYERNVSTIHRKEARLRIKFHIDLDASDVDALQALPWEFLVTPRDQLLAIDPNCTIVRSIAIPGFAPIRTTGLQRILIVAVGTTPGIDSEIDGITQSFAGIQAAEVVVLKNATVQDLRRAVETEKFDVFHYTGHSLHGRSRNEELLMGDDEILPAQILGQLLRTQTSLRIAFLNSCPGKGRIELGWSGSAAARFLQIGASSVISWQLPVRDRAASTFAVTFYQSLVAGNSTEAAVHEGRKAIQSVFPQSFDLFGPVLFLRESTMLSRSVDALTPEVSIPDRLASSNSPSSDPTPLHLDSPAVDDRLGRRGFARALSIRLERIWHEMNPRDRPTDRPVPQGSFVLHLHGPWGSGKSSILEMLRRELKPERTPAAPTVASPWVVVDFNAWQNQRLDPPWWPLLDGIFRQSARQLPWWRRMWLRAHDGFWRFSTRRRDLLIFSLVALSCGVLGYQFLWPTIAAQWKKPLETTGDMAEKVTAILGLLTLVTSWIWLGSRSLISGSARAVQSFLDSAADPMDRIQRHFQKMVRTVDRPIAVFVDDLDRCQAGYVVQLLEGIQTLFRDPRVVYVIAADQRWLHSCFEKTYEAFADSVREPGKRLGSLFLEKAFEISVALPELTPGVRAEYWRFLLGGDPVQAEQRLAEFEQEARAEFRQDRSEAKVIERLDKGQGEAESYDPLRAQARRQVAVEQLASAVVEKSVSYFLQPFAPLLEPNPRSMKRLLNAYAIGRDLAILSGLDVLAHEGRRKKLALWTILALRWPALEDFLREKAGGDDSEPSSEVSSLLSSREVAEVVEGKDLGGPLTLDDLKELLGFKLAGVEADTPKA